MTEPLTGADQHVLCEELRILRQQNAALDAQLTAVRSDSIEIAKERNQLREETARLHWRAAMVQIDVGQKALEQLAAADALADVVEMAETSVKWFAWPDLAAALLVYRERRGRNAV